ncbi:MAG: histidine--tRNA ligase [Methanobacteriota archaeon]|nr:MAG: histidine--tRNA ligase [Euryarchaeota archaeon]
MMFTRPRGTRDILPDEMERRRRAEAILRDVFQSFGYREVQTPVFEHLELITAKSGEEIKEHLYSFEDKSGRKLALRPELSAPTIRLYVNELRTRPKPRKLCYFENCFRYERPQKGRYREFWQAGVELIGSRRPEAEAEVIALAVRCLEEIGLERYALVIGNRGIFRALFDHYNISEDVQNTIFHLMDKRDLQGLQRYLDAGDITEEARDFLWRLVKVIDRGRGIGVVELEEGLTDRARGIVETELEGFKELTGYLGDFGVRDYEIDFLIARGLDYYTGMVFEIHAEGLGAQNQICGGGTYSLARLFGGGDVPSCGFAFGFDRLMLALDAQEGDSEKQAIPRVFVAPASKKVLNRAIEISTLLRRSISCTMEIMGRKLDKALSYADSEGIPYVVIVSEEVKGDSVILRDMRTGEQRVIKIEEVPDAVG